MSQAFLQSIYRILEVAESDRKTLSQGGLKLCEEAGEVARAINALEGAHGVGHRDENVLEELADSIMVAISLLPKIDKTLEELQAVMETKIDKWETVLAKG